MRRVTEWLLLDHAPLACQVMLGLALPTRCGQLVISFMICSFSFIGTDFFCCAVRFSRHTVCVHYNSQSLFFEMTSLRTTMRLTDFCRLSWRMFATHCIHFQNQAMTGMLPSSTSSTKRFEVCYHCLRWLPNSTIPRRRHRMLLLQKRSNARFVLRRFSSRQLSHSAVLLELVHVLPDQACPFTSLNVFFACNLLSYSFALL